MSRRGASTYFCHRSSDNFTCPAPSGSPGFPFLLCLLLPSPLVDVDRVTIKETDEFILLGCDGIWDCLTNEQAVQYVRTRLDQRTPSQIGIEMLDEILSEDPRATQGIGGDNMTIMIVDLHPHKRNYRRTPPADVLPSPT